MYNLISVSARESRLTLRPLKLTSDRHTADKATLSNLFIQEQGTYKMNIKYDIINI